MTPLLPRRAVLAAAGCAALVAAGATIARADTTPTDTTQTPTVTEPDAAPTPVPKPDPGPVRTTEPPHRVVAPPVRPARSAPSVAPVYRAPVTKVFVAPKPRSVPKAHKRRVHRLAHKHRKAPRPADSVRPAQKPSVVPAATKPKPKPKPRAPKTSTTVSANAPRAGVRRWATAAGASLGVLVLTGLIVAVMRRPRGSGPEPLAEPPPAPAPPSRQVPPVPPTSGASHERPTEELRPLELLVAAPEREPLAPPSERCSIAWWRGYVRSQFIAYAGSGDVGAIVAESPSFAWRSRKPPPQTDDALAAHTRLLEQLSKLGWEAEDSGPAWFESTFQRAAVGALSRPEVPVG